MSTSVMDLLQTLKSKNVNLSVVDGNIRVEAEDDTVVDNSLVEKIRANKPDLIKMLESNALAKGEVEFTIDPDSRYEPFELSDVQQAYWVGRTGNFDLGNISTHIYSEFENEGIDIARFTKAWNIVIQRHDMLRSIVRDDGLQQVLRQVPEYQPVINDLTAFDAPERDARLQEIREQLSHQVLKPDVWPLFEFQITLISDSCVRIHMSIDLLIADGRSCEIILGELSHFYKDVDAHLPPLELTFRDCIAHEIERKATVKYANSLAYWQERLKALPSAPELPLNTGSVTDAPPVFKRFKGRLDAKRWAKIKEGARFHGISPSTMLIAAYSLVLAKWSKSSDFTLNLTLFNRQAVHSQIDSIIGDFTSLTLLEIRNAGMHSIVDFARQIQKRMWEDLDHREIGGVQVIRELTKIRGGDNTSMPIVFTSTLDNSEQSLFAETSHEQNGETEEVVEVIGIGKEVYGISQTPQVWIDHQVAERGAALVFNWDTVEGLFEDTVIESMFDCYLSVLDQLADVGQWTTPNAIRAELPHRDRTIIEQYNQSEQQIPARLLHDLFLDSVKAFPDYDACITSEHTLTYHELDVLSNQLACALTLDRMLGPGDIVAIYLEKGWQQIVSVLAVLKCGAAYLPLSTDWPSERINTVLRESGTQVVLIGEAQSEATRAVTGALVGQLIPVSRELLSEFNKHFTPASLATSDLAYVIYTSGSSGVPKGVMVTHEQATNTITNINQRYQLNEKDRLLAVSALSFDLSVYDVLGALSAGAGIVLPDAESVNDPAHWCTLVNQHHCTVWNSVPALMQMLVTYVKSYGYEERVSGLRCILLSGDWIPVSLPEAIHQCVGDARVVGLGGATEAAIWSIAYDVVEPVSTFRSVPYGKPLANQQLYVLDEQMAPKPLSVPGDLYIGGAGVASGYLNDETKSREAFIKHEEFKTRLYKTGDKARLLSDGNIEFLGRDDEQVKIRGYRIELGEVESALNQHDAIENSVVCARGEAFERKVLIGFYVSEHNVNEQELIETVARQVPGYAVPAHFVRINSIPLSSNGKVNRKWLLKHTQYALNDVADVIELETTIEKAIGEVWASRLDVRRLGKKSNFFESGGDSIIANQVVIETNKRFKKNVSMKDLFDFPMLEDFAALVQNRDVCIDDDALVEEDLPSVYRDEASVNTPFPLTGLQQAYFVGRSDAFALGNVACHQYQEVDIEDLDFDRLSGSWNTVLARHDILRTRFLPDGKQMVMKDEPVYQIDHNDLSGLIDDEKQRVLLKIREQLSHQVMNIFEWPLFDIRITKIDDKTSRLHLSIDAMIADAWSVGLISDEVASLYTDPAYALDNIGITFREYVLTEEKLKESEIYGKSMDYWTNRLETLPAAPQFHFVKEVSEIEVPSFKRRESYLSEASWQVLRAKATKVGLTPAGLILAVYAEVISTWSKTPHFTINVPQFNRFNFHPDVEKLIGEFASFYLVEIDNSVEPGFLNRAKRVQRQLWDDINHRYVSGMHVIRELGKVQGDGTPIEMPVVFTSILGLIDSNAADVPNPEDSALSKFGKLVHGISQTPQVWLDCQVGEQNGNLTYNWDSVDELFPEGMLDDMFCAFDGLIHALAEETHPWENKPLDLVPQRDLDLVERSNSTGVVYKFTPVNQLIDEAARQFADRVALADQSRQLSYAEVIERSQLIAGWLRQQHVEPGELVPIIMDKSLDQVIAALAVGRVGAAFVPIDTETPAEGVLELLSSTEAKVVLVSDEKRPLIPWPEQISVGSCDALYQQVEIKAFEGLVERQPNDPVYVIYTSGSTGVPKGCVISNNNLHNLICHTNKALNVTERDKALLVTPFHHDLAMYDVFGMLSCGGGVVVPDHERRKDPEHWFELLNAHDVSLWNSVPAVMEMLVLSLENHGSEPVRLPGSLRQVILGGDWIPVSLPGRIQALCHDVPCEVLGIGGPTETTIWNIWYPVERDVSERASIPYGKPTSNNRYYVLDERLQQRPVGVAGQLYCAGAQVGSGYWRNEAATSDRFFDHPLTGEHLYRTGDQGRYLADGNIEFLGRMDSQLKIRGYRIEPGEIEQALCAHEQVDNAVVMSLNDKEGQKKLIGFVAQIPLTDSERDQGTGGGIHALAEIPDLPKGILTDPFERLDFKSKKHGIRKDLEERDSIHFVRDLENEEFINRFIDRRSHRIFRDTKISAREFGEFLSALQSIEVDKLGFPKYLYPSGGGLYPVQIYLYINPDKVEGITGGGYYYQPDEHALIHISDYDNGKSENGPHELNDQPFIDECGFTVVLVGDTSAIFPMYGEKLGTHLMTIEAGVVAQTLENHVLNTSIGLCQLGTIDEEFVRQAFELGEQHAFLHCMIGGGIEVLGSGCVKGLLEDSAAYSLTGEPDDGRLGALTLQIHLKQKLPEYKIPSEIIVLDRLPLSGNGKIDRKALLRQYSGSFQVQSKSTEYVEPRNSMERMMSEIWSEILEIEKVGIYDNFVELGGNSIHVVRLHNRLKEEFETDIAIYELFQFGDIATLCEHLGDEEGQSMDLDESSERADRRRQELDNRARARRVDEEEYAN